MAPIKALCTERFEDWQNKFGPLGLKCKELTGDTELDDYFELQDVNIILTTPVRVFIALTRGNTTILKIGPDKITKEFNQSEMLTVFLFSFDQGPIRSCSWGLDYYCRPTRTV